MVAPRRGAWIEIRRGLDGIPRHQVAPRRGAWIEMPLDRSGRGLIESLPAGERGSKSRRREPNHGHGRRSPQGSVDRNNQTRPAREQRPVAPRRGAWIEILKSPTCEALSNCRSPQGSVDRNQRVVDHESMGTMVAPRRGAWIEIIAVSSVARQAWSLPAGERGSKYGRTRPPVGRNRRSPQGSVDRNNASAAHFRMYSCRSPQGSVDRNNHVLTLC